MLTTEALISITNRIRDTIPMEHMPVETRILEFIDMGHGGFLNGEYTTAPEKMYDHGEFVFYEGVWTRALGWMYALDLYTNGLGYSIVSPGNRDRSLYSRYTKANDQAKSFKGRIKTYYHSIHGNAFGIESVNGIEVFTAPGLTDADPIATVVIRNLHRALGWRRREDWSDGDPDKEARFGVLVKTDMPAFLSENGFYTNLAECKKMLEYSNMQAMSCAFLETHLTVLHKRMLS